MSRLARLERLAPLLAGIAVAVPIFVFYYPPMGDLPMHEALVAILRHRGDPAFAPPGLYEVVAPQANQLFHFVAFLLSFVVGVTMACKLVVAASVVLVPTAAGELLGRLGRSRWPAVLLAPIARGWTFRWGLVPNLLGFALLLVGLSFLEALARRPTARRAVAASVAAVVIFFAHESSALVFAMVAGYLAVVRGGPWSVLARRLAPVVVTLVLALVQQRIAQAVSGAMMQAIGTEYGLDPVDRLAILPGAVFGGYDTARVAAIGVVWLLGVFACGIARGKPRDLEPPIRVALWRYRHAVLAALFFFLYLGFPMTLAGTTLLAHRFLPIMATFVVLAVAPRRLRSTVVPALVLTAPLVMLAVTHESAVFVDRSYRDLDAVLSHLPDRVAVAQLDLTPRRPGLMAPVPGAANRALTAHGGRMLFTFTDTPPNPIYVRADARWSEPILRLAVAPFAFMPAWDLRRFGYVLVRQERQDLAPLMARAFAPDAELVAGQGEWLLFRAVTPPVVPLDGPDEDVPTPTPEPLAARLRRLRAKDQAAPREAPP